MIRKFWLALPASMIGAAMLLIFHGWREGGLDLLLPGVSIC